MGAVESPGSYRLPAGQSDLLSALVVAGGLSPQADRTVEIRHPPEPEPGLLGLDGRRPDRAAQVGQGARTELGADAGGPVVVVDLVEAAQGRATDSLRLRDGSLVHVCPRPAQTIHVIGLVNRPNQFPLPPNQELRLLEAIALGGGLTVSIANKVYVIRKLAHTDEAIVIRASVREAKKHGEANIRLMAGDVVSVEETPATFVVGLLRQLFNVGVSSPLAL
jgi:protein involved in polysaccharide export with SLBB domain